MWLRAIVAYNEAWLIESFYILHSFCSNLMFIEYIDYIIFNLVHYMQEHRLNKHIPPFFTYHSPNNLIMSLTDKL